MPRILALQLKRIGDLILTAPALAALRSALPDCEIVLLSAANAAGLARCFSSVNRVVPYRPGRLNANAWSSALAGPWDVCLDFTGTDRSALLTGLSRARRRLGFAKFSAKPLRRLAYTEFCEASVRELHTLDFHAALAEQGLGHPLPPADNVCPLSMSAGVARSAEEKLSAAGITGPYAVLHPGTVKAEKFWVSTRWAGVADHLVHRSGLKVLLTGNREGMEHDHLLEIKKHLTVPVSDLTGMLSLEELAEIIRRSSLMLGVDSMAMHLAALFRRPQVALFGPTNPFHWRPRHDRALVLHGPQRPPVDFAPRAKPHDMKEISTVAVIDAMDSLLAA